MPDDNCCAVRIVLREEAPRIVVCFEPTPPVAEVPEESVPGGPLFTVGSNLVWLTNFF